MDARGRAGRFYGQNNACDSIGRRSLQENMVEHTFQASHPVNPSTPLHERQLSGRLHTQCVHPRTLCSAMPSVLQVVIDAALMQDV